MALRSLRSHYCSLSGSGGDVPRPNRNVQSRRGKGMKESWSLEWSHGRTLIHAGAGAIGKTDFRLEDGRWLSPFHEDALDHPWRSDRISLPQEFARRLAVPTVRTALRF